MKRFLSLLLVAIMLLAIVPFSALNVSAETTWAVRNSYPSGDSWRFYSAPLNNYPINTHGGNCTWYAYGRAYEVFGKDCGLGAAGDAGNWYYYAKNRGMAVGQEPKAGSIICWSTHVAFVERVDGNAVTWTESHWYTRYGNFNSYTSTHPSTYTGTFLGYIYIDGTPAPQPDPIEYENIAEGKYYIKNKANGEYVSVSEGIDANKQNVNTWPFLAGAEFQMNLTKASSGYKIRPQCSSSRLINAYGTTVSSGNNVNLYDDCNESSQWWGFEKVSGGGYIIRNMMNPNCVLTLASDRDIRVSNYTGADTQIWYLQTTVDYNANGGWGAPERQLKNYGETLSISYTVPSRDVYNFLGWSTNQWATLPDYRVGDGFNVNSNTVLYAVWEEAYDDGGNNDGGYTEPLPDYGIAIDNSNNLAYGKPYFSTQPFRQGGADVNWQYDENAPEAYPDENGITLTDGYIANDYYDYQEPSWVGYNAKSPFYTESFGNYIEIDLGAVYDIAEVTAYVGTEALSNGAGISVPQRVEFWVSETGSGWYCAKTVYPSESTELQIPVTADLSGTRARYVQVSLFSESWAFISEITVAEDLNPNNGNNSAVSATISVPETYYPDEIITVAVTFENVSYEDGIHAFIGNLYYDTDKIAPVFIDPNSDFIPALDPYAEWEDMTQWKIDNNGKTCIQLVAMTPDAVDNVITHVYLGETITFYVDFSVLPNATGDINFEITSDSIKAYNFFNNERVISCAGDSATIREEVIDNGTDNVTPEESFMLGDINQNGKIDMTDYILLKRAYFGTYTFSAAQNKAGDINQNNKIDMTDYILLKRVYFGTYTIKK